jgi:sulfatase modifying factor 1
VCLRTSVTLVIAISLQVVLPAQGRADTFGSGTNEFEIDFVTIGNPGNAPDTTGNPNPAGSVSTRYRIGKYEISEQMVDKANSLGILGIAKDSRGADKPATSVTWNEAARFVNWLNISSGSSPAYKFSSQPGEPGYNATDNIQVWTSSDAGYNSTNLYRNSLAKYFLPSVDEWYKAAFYDPANGTYFDYPTGSNSVPTPVASGTAAGTAVYNGQSGPADVSLAGGTNAYGLIGQAGNALEWLETDLDLVNGPNPNTSRRAVRGGHWNTPSNILTRQVGLGDYVPGFEALDVGFRVAASIPEPASMLMAFSAASMLMMARRRSNSK